MNVPRHWQLSDQPSSARLEVTHQSLVDFAAVTALLRQARSGWICTTDRAQPLGAALPDGMPLSAEFVLDERTSVHLRQAGAAWSVWTYEDAVGVGPMLAFEESYLSTEMSIKGTGKRRRLKYRTFWRLEPQTFAKQSASASDEANPDAPGAAGSDDVKVWRPFAARFIGWGEGNE